MLHLALLVASSTPSTTTTSPPPPTAWGTHPTHTDGLDPLASQYCPWLDSNTSELGMLQCFDGHKCFFSPWYPGGDPACCDGHGGRAMCPPDFPTMCASTQCANGTDHCCSSLSCEDPGLNVFGERECNAPPFSPPSIPPSPPPPSLPPIEGGSFAQVAEEDAEACVDGVALGAICFPLQWLWLVVLLSVLLLLICAAAYYYYRIRKTVKGKFPPAVDMQAEEAKVQPFDIEAVFGETEPPEEPCIDEALEEELKEESPEDRVRRLEWIRYYVHNQDLMRAHDLGWDGKPFKMTNLKPIVGSSPSDVTVDQHSEDLGAGALPPRNVHNHEAPDADAAAAADDDAHAEAKKTSTQDRI